MCNYERGKTIGKDGERKSNEVEEEGGGREEGGGGERERRGEKERRGRGEKQEEGRKREDIPLFTQCRPHT